MTRVSLANLASPAHVSNTLTCLLTLRFFLPLAPRCRIWFTSISPLHRGMPLGFRGAGTNFGDGGFITGGLRRRRRVHQAFAWKHWDKTMIMITVERNVELRIFNSCRLVLLSFVWTLKNSLVLRLNLEELSRVLKIGRLIWKAPLLLSVWNLLSTSQSVFSSLSLLRRLTKLWLGASLTPCFFFS